MPIQGLSDKQTREENPIDFPLLARVKKGAVKPERGVGRNLDYFRFDWVDTDAQALFESMYGNEPDTLQIVLLGATTDAAFDSWYRKYGRNEALQRKCDGCIIAKAANRDLIGGACICDPEARDDKQHKDHSKMCQPQGLLYFTIADFCARLGYVGMFMLKTGSTYEISKITTLLHGIEMTHGTLVGQVFKMTRVEKSHEVEGKNIKDWEVQLTPPIQAILPVLSGSGVVPQQSAQLPDAPAQLPSGDSDDSADDDPEPQPAMSDNQINIIEGWGEKVFNTSLADMLTKLTEDGIEARDPLEAQSLGYDMLRYMGQVLSWVAEYNMRDGRDSVIGMKINTWQYELDAHRHVFQIGNRKVYLFSREPLRLARVHPDLIDMMESANFSFTDVQVAERDIPVFIIHEAFDEHDQHKYFHVVRATASKNIMADDPDPDNELKIFRFNHPTNDIVRLPAGNLMVSCSRLQNVYSVYRAYTI